MRQLSVFVLPLALGITGVPADDPIFTPPDQTCTSNEHTVTIRRAYNDAEQAKLILTAECTMPESDDVVQVMQRRGKEALEAAPTEHPWWFDTFDGVFIPYAVTAQALSYYVGLSESFRKGDFSRSNDIKMKHSSLTYSAEVTRHRKFEYQQEVFQDVSVVRMSLSWTQYCGPLCAMGFMKERVVVFDNNGTVARIFHDGRTGYAVK